VAREDHPCARVRSQLGVAVVAVLTAHHPRAVPDRCTATVYDKQRNPCLTSVIGIR
jgi:hypothetical protein